MLMKRIYAIVGLLLVGVVITSMSVWSLAFNMNSSNVPAWSTQWLIARLPILLGVLLVIGGFKLLSHTRLSRPIDDLDDPAP